MKHLKRLLLCCLLSFAGHCFGQTVTIKISDLDHPSRLPGMMKSIAQQLLNTFTVEDSITDMDHLFRLQLCAGQYTEGVKTLQLYRHIQPDQRWDGLPALGAQFELTGIAFLRLQQTKEDSSSVIYALAGEIYQQLPDPAKPYMQQFFHPDLEGLQQRFALLLSEMKAAPKGRVTRVQAIKFCRLYLSLEIARQINRDALRFLLDEDNKHYLIDDSLMIPGADSALLTAVVVRKIDQVEPQPVILVYSIYAGPGDLGIAKRAADHGYVGVVVNTRGKNLSTSSIAPFEYDAADSWPVLDYLSKQEYCDGSIGMYGGSYLGFSQWSALKKPHPALKTIVPQVAVAPGIDFPATGGVNSTYMYQWLRYVSDNPLTDYLTFNNSAYWDSLNVSWFASGIPFAAFDSLAGKKDHLFRKWITHPTMDAYWQSMIPYQSEFADIDIPILSITGYFDDDQAGALYYFYQHQQYGRNPRHYLVMGPWNHFGAQASPAAVLREMPVDSAGLIQIEDLVFEWMDHIFRAKPLPALIKDKINLQVMGANTWWSGKTISAADGDSLVLHLVEHPQDGYILSEATPAVTRRISLEWKEMSLPDKNNGYDALVPLLDSVLPVKSGLTFRSGELKDTSYVHGRYTVELKMIPDCHDADLITRLYEETADGHYFLLSSGLRRISYQPTTTEAVYMKPGELNQVRLEALYFTERMIRPGSRIVLWLDIHAAPSFEFNTGIKGPVSQQSRLDFKGLHLKILSESTLSVPMRTK